MHWDDRMTLKFEQLLKDPSADIRGETAVVLGASGVTDATAGIIELLKDKDPRCGEKAVYALQRLGGDRAVDALMGILIDGKADTKVRDAAARSLSSLKNNRVIDPLIDAIQQSSQPSYFVPIERVLWDLTGKNFRRPRDWKAWQDGQRRDTPRDSNSDR
jgi:HEAT repeat protein